MIFNLPNTLTILRMVFVPIFLVLLFSFPKTVYGITAALVVFIAASLTDLYDGRIARQRKQETNFGKVMDPLADKLLVLSAFVSFVQMDLIPGWMVVVISARELVVTSVRMFALSQGKVMASISSGKHKTAWQIAVIIEIILVAWFQRAFDLVKTPGMLKELVTLQGTGSDIGVAALLMSPYFFTLVVASISLFSAWDLLRKNRLLFS